MMRITAFALCCFSLGCTFLTRANCGDGVIDQNNDETCDDKNLNNDDGCDSLCKIEPGFVCPVPGKDCIKSCGNGQVDDEFNEECDDGDATSGDGCSANCEVEPGFVCPNDGQDCISLCGNNQIDADEECDGAQLSVPDCDALPGNQFNVGALSCNDDCSFNTSQCILAICPNGLTEPGEECDDDNAVDTDGCTSLCVSGPVCDDNAFQNNERNFATAAATGHCYFMIDDGRDFGEAEGDCASRGGHLASIADADENNIVAQVADQSVWIGANDQSNEDTFVWTDNTTFVFENFNFGQPDDFGTEDCVEMFDNGGWNDVGCGFDRRPVCEILP
jgi:cysteine-rich repeat protein